MVPSHVSASPGPGPGYSGVCQPQEGPGGPSFGGRPDLFGLEGVAVGGALADLEGQLFPGASGPQCGWPPGSCPSGH
eukprot:2157093-Alexandrium_andersonii.AAC.1